MIGSTEVIAQEAETVNARTKRQRKLWLGSLEGILAVANAALVSWLFALGGIHTLADAVQLLFYSPTGTGVRPSEAVPWAYIATLPFVLPVGLFGLMSQAVFVHTWGTIANTWFWLGVNAVLWGEGVAFFFRLIRTGNLRYARDEMFRWTKTLPIRDPSAAPRPSKRHRRSRGLG